MELNQNVLISDATLEAYYRFNTGALVTDSAGSNTLTNNNTVGELAAGKFGVSADFGAGNSDKYFNINTDIGIAGNSDMTINMWVKFRTDIGSGVYRLASHRSTSGADRYFLTAYEHNSGTRRLWVNGAGTQFTHNVTLGTSWHMLTFVRVAAGNNAIYVDGALGNSGANGTGTGGADDVVIGRQENSDANFFSDYMDDVSFFSKALNAGEIQDLWADGGGFLINLL